MTGSCGLPTVIGIGNVLLGDDGAGVRTVELLRTTTCTARLVDGGTLGLDLLGIVAEAGVLVLVDAMDLGLEPGTVRVLRDHELAASGGVGELVATARLTGRLPASIALVGIQMEQMEPGTGLSPRVAAALPTAAAIVQDVLAGLTRLGAQAEAAA